MPTFTFEELSQPTNTFTFEEATQSEDIQVPSTESQEQATTDVQRRILAEEEGTVAQLSVLSTSTPVVPLTVKRKAPEPQGLMEPFYGIPRAELPPLPPGQEWPTAVKVGAGAYNVLAGATEALETPASVATMGVAGLGTAAGRIAAGAWSLYMATKFPDLYKRIQTAFQSGDAKQITEAVGEAAVMGAATTAGSIYAARGPKAPVQTLIDKTAETAPVTAKVLEQTIKPESEVPSASSIEKAAEIHANVPSQPRAGEGQMPAEISGEGVQPLRGGQPAQGGAIRPQGEAQYPVAAKPALTPEEVSLRSELEQAGFSTREATQPPTAPSEIVGMGGATPAEFQPARQTATGIKNAAVDAERQARGQPPILAPERLRNPVVWDRAMAKIDTDPAWQDRLIAELQESPRTPSAEEIVALDHRYVDLQNEYAKATRDGAQHFADGYMEGVKQATERATFYESQLGQLEQVARKVGTEWGRSGQMRQRLMREDFSLAAMEAKMRAAKGFEPLTDQEHIEIGDLAGKLEKAEKAAEQSEQATPRAKTGGLGPDAARKRGEVDIIKQRFERKLSEERLKRLTRADRIWTGSKEALNLSRSILTSWDLSAVFRQGGFIALGNPIRAARAMGPMFKALASEKGAAAVEAEILSRPNVNLYKQGDLFLAPREGGKLTGLEEAFMSRIATRIPGVAGSNRAYVTFLNRLRADTFDALHNSLASIKGEAPTVHELKAIGNYINVATGRGNLGKAAAAAETLSTVFFAPRLVASRFQIVAGQPFYRGSHATRQLIAKEYGKFLAGLATIYGLGMMAGATVENDPRSTEFGKLKFGNTRVDPMSGLSQVTVLLSRLASGEIKNAHGKFDTIRGDVRYGHRTAADVIATFLRTKLSPVIGTSVDILTGKNVVGEEATPAKIATNLAVPISFQDIYDVMREQGIPAGTAMAILAIFGMNVQTYQSGKKPK